MTARLLGRTGLAAGIDSALGELARLGAAPGCDLQIAVDGVSREHARIWRESSDYWIEDLRSTNGTFLNSVRVVRDRLRHLDVITLGRNVDLIFLQRSASPVSPPQASIVGASFEWKDGPDVGKTVEIARGEMTMGRAEANTVVLGKSAVSKVHVRLRLTPDQLLIEDLASANGTFVNGSRLEGATMLDSGDVVSLGGILSFEVTVSRQLSAAPVSREAPTAVRQVFDNEWRTRLVWSAEELSIVEAAREKAMRIAALRPSVLPSEREQGPSDAVVVAPAAAPPPVAPPAPTAGPSADVNAIPAAVQAAAGQVGQPPEGRGPGNTAAPGVGPLALPSEVLRASATPVADVESPSGGAQTRGPSAGGAGAIPSAVLSGAAEADGGVANEASRALPIQRVTLIGREKRYSLERGEHVIGRLASCAIQLNSPEISRSHTRVRVTAEAVEVEDLSSGNGTLVNGRPVSTDLRVRDGDILTLGSFAFRLEISRADEAVP